MFTLSLQRQLCTLKLLPEPSNVLQKGRPFRPELPFHFLAQSSRQGRTLSVGGDRDLQRSTSHHGGIKEVAVLGVVHHVAENAVGPASEKHMVVDCHGIRSGYDEKCTAHITGSKCPRTPNQFARPRFVANPGDRLRGHDNDLRSVAQQPCRFRCRNSSRADDYAGATFKPEEDREGSHWPRAIVSQKADRG